MKLILSATVTLMLVACAAHPSGCHGKLQPINPQAPAAVSGQSHP